LLCPWQYGPYRNRAVRRPSISWRCSSSPSVQVFPYLAHYSRALCPRRQGREPLFGPPGSRHGRRFDAVTRGPNRLDGCFTLDNGQCCRCDASQPNDGFVPVTVNLAICRERLQSLPYCPPSSVASFGFGLFAVILSTLTGDSWGHARTEASAGGVGDGSSDKARPRSSLRSKPHLHSHPRPARPDHL
jgi:hypothetical protein